MIDIQESPLGALEQDALAGVGKVLQYLRNVGGYRRDNLRRSECLVQRPGKVDRVHAEIIS